MNLVSLVSYTCHVAFGLELVEVLTSSFFLCTDSDEDIPLHTSNGTKD